MLTYASTDDLTAQGVLLSDDDAGALQVASGLVADAISGAFYATDDDDMPTDTRLREAVRDATVMQVRMWRAAGINPLSAGMDLPAPSVASRSQGGRSESYSDLSTSVTVQQSRQAAVTQLCAAAWSILSRAGLTGGQPVTTW